MNFFGIFKREKNKLPVNKKERKEFLSNDFIERMIRVEQKVSSSLGQKIHYKKTDYYKTLKKKEKYSFEKYLTRKQKKKGILLIVFMLSIFSIVFIQPRFTGNFIIENLGINNFSIIFLLNIVVVLGVFLVFLCFVFTRIRRKIRDKKYLLTVKRRNKKI